jgi:hypothetical protein
MLLLMTVCLIYAPGAHAQFGGLFKGAKKLFKGGGLSNDEIVRGLKEALEVGTGNAVETVSGLDGYLKNPDIKIPLPGAVEKAESFLRTVGYGAKVDAFELSMNRAAERAAPQAKALFWDAIKSMSFEDARRILQGREDEATRYFREKTEDPLMEAFKPVVHDAMSEVGVTRTYQDLETKIKTIPFLGGRSFDLDGYVTQGALDGLFFMLAQEEKRIREDPAARVTDLLQKVFEKTK